jgi:hypothetical protein
MPLLIEMPVMPLQPVCEEKYQEMLSEIYQSRRLDLCPATRIAYCFKLSVEYWTRLNDCVKASQFTDSEEEIWFFKTMKPRFTSLIEYYTLIYHAELFMPSLSETETNAFWKKENEKAKKFYRQYSDFCKYYKAGRTDMDHVYFLRHDLKPSGTYGNRLYDTDPEMVAPYGHLATSLLAYDMYATYILQQVNKVAGDQ